MDRYGAIIYAAGLAFTAVAKTPPLLVYSVLFTSVATLNVCPHVFQSVACPASFGTCQYAR